VYILKHLPGLVRPALPARCIAEACDTDVTINLSMLVAGLYILICVSFSNLHEPRIDYINNSLYSYRSLCDIRSTNISINYTTTFLVPGTGVSNAFSCSSVGKPAYSGTA
jgi:hypothetical protein